jgi:hypothetical protein
MASGAKPQSLCIADNDGNPAGPIAEVAWLTVYSRCAVTLRTNMLARLFRSRLGFVAWRAILHHERIIPIITAVTADNSKVSGTFRLARLFHSEVRQSS